MRIITIEEHFMSKKINDRYNQIIKPKTDLEKANYEFVNNFVNRGEITNISNERIEFMDRNGIDTQIVGYGNNSPMHLDKEHGAIELCKLANDELFEATQKFNGRIYGYATLPVCDIKESIKELERCIKELGFKGWMINGTFKGEFLDKEKYYEIFKMAEQLDIPVYLHPAELKGEILDRYYIGNWNLMTSNIFSGFGIGWHYDTAMHLMRLILSGIFDKLPNLKIIIGHWGELLPFYFDRINYSLIPKVTGLKHDIKYYFYNNIYTNPSGMFYKDDFEFCLKTMNIEHIMWAQDYPYGINDEQVRTFLEKYEISNEIKEMIAYKNAEKLFKL